MPARTRAVSGDRAAARAQLKTADQSARVAKENRANDAGEEITVPFGEKEYRVGKTPSVMALMEWGAASGGESLVACYHVLEDLVHPDDWDEFRKDMRNVDAVGPELVDFINAGVEALAGRPTEESAGS